MVVTLVGVGECFGVALVAVPLVAGRRLVRLVANADPETALRTATYCWPPAMVVVFGLFVSPGGAGRVTFFHLGGSESCLLGFRGVSVRSLAAVLLGAPSRSSDRECSACCPSSNGSNTADEPPHFRRSTTPRQAAVITRCN